MSHFTVLVIGENVEEQLAPYDENMEVEAYIDGTAEDTAKTLAEALDYFQNRAEPNDRRHQDKVLDDLTIDEKRALLEDYEGARYHEDDGGNLIRYSTYNPESKWDWYSIGGRWSGFFLVKPGTPEGAYKPSGTHWTELMGVEDPEEKARLEKEVKQHRTDQTLLKYIDVELMRVEAGIEANERFDELERVTQGITPPTESWKQVADRHLGDLANSSWSEHNEEQTKLYRERLDAARQERHAHPWIKATRELRMFEDPYEVFHLHAENPRESFVNDKVNGAIATYAVVKDGIWYGRGNMGWWGMSSNEADEAEWLTKIAELLDGLPEDTLITLIDAHI